MLVIGACQEHFTDYCIAEIKAACPGAALVKWLAPGTGLFEAGPDFEAFEGFARAVIAAKPIFLRHICPACAGSPEFLAETLARKIERPFSVQARVLGGGGDKYGLEQLFLSKIQAGQAPLDVENPEQVISVVAAGDCVYAGVSDARLNLSPWPGGMRRFAREDSRISRAEFKLLEAIEVFGADLSSVRKAADFGAAPGGWSRTLAERGVAVTAIDPARLSPELESAPLITHYKGLAQDFIKQNRDRGAFQLLVNDMRMDIGASTGLMAEAGALLAENGLLIMTFKLPPKKRLAAINNGLDILKTVYNITHVKQLFHNRSEVTAAGILR